jgi:hypothetical protein
MKVLSVAAAAVLAAAPLFAQGASSAAPAAKSPAPPLSNSIKWSTASEVENFGYDVFRGDREEGPFTRLNAKTIAGAGTVDEPRAYEYVDATIEAGKVYWYYVESISLSGVREKFTPVFRSKPKNADGTPAAVAEEPAKPKS